MVGFAGSSAFWLLLAFLMTARGYGELMTAQAAVLLVVTALTFRTHDLFFNLVTQHGQPASQAYRAARTSELASAGLAAAIAASGAAFVLPRAGEPEGFAIVSGYALLAALGANQGAAIARLRHLQRGDVIARTDAVAAALWGAACLIALLLPRGAHAYAPLLVGATPPFARSILLARAARRLAPAPDVDIAAPPPTGAAARYLAGAQLTNFLKNGAVSIETVILASFASAPVVAMYRVARAVLGLGVAAINVAYQRTYPALVRAAGAADIRMAIAALERRSLGISLLTYPVSALTALAYAWLKPEVGIAALQLLTLGTFAASLPAALQQGAFAILSLRGEHRAANTAYVLWFAVLACGSAVLLWAPRLEVFVAALILAGAARLWYLRRRARQAEARFTFASAGPSVPQTIESERPAAPSTSAAAPSSPADD